MRKHKEIEQEDENEDEEEQGDMYKTRQLVMELPLRS